MVKTMLKKLELKEKICNDFNRELLIIGGKKKLNILEEWKASKLNLDKKTFLKDIITESTPLGEELIKASTQQQQHQILEINQQPLPLLNNEAAQVNLGMSLETELFYEKMEPIFSKDESWILEYIVYFKEYGIDKFILELEVFQDDRELMVKVCEGLREYDVDGRLFDTLAKLLGQPGELELAANMYKPEIYKTLLYLYCKIKEEEAVLGTDSIVRGLTDLADVLEAESQVSYSDYLLDFLKEIDWVKVAIAIFIGAAVGFV